MKKQQFGGNWTQEKLERVRKYLQAYTTIFANNPRAKKLKPIYVDAFAGSGYRTRDGQQPSIPDLFPEFVEADTQAFIKGSARIALEVDPPFKGYLFIEQDQEYAQELQKLKQEFSDKTNLIEIVKADANAYLKEWCAATDWNGTRAVVFLDPYGMQVDWTVIEAIAATQSIDLWILFPIGMAVNRLLTTDGPPPKEWQQALTRIFGTEAWQEAFYQTQNQQNLFGEQIAQQVKLADFKKIGQFFVDRLKTVFAGVADKPLPLMNSKNNPLYLLCFASGNPKGAPTAIKIANDILKG
ncbi:MAG: three-Cys-motif partner protein TcmP [Acidiferrobacteraceae bacterium]